MASSLLEQWPWEHIRWIRRKKKKKKQHSDRKQSNLLKRLCYEMALELLLQGYESRNSRDSVAGGGKNTPKSPN